MKYTCLNTDTFADGPYQLTPIRLQDIYLIKEWRNAQIDVLRQNVLLTDQMQKNYFENVILPTFSASHPEQILFSYLEEGKLIGYGGIVHIDWNTKQGEVSFLIETLRAANQAVYENDLLIFLKMIKNVAFNGLHFNRLSTETYAIRPHHISILERAGFIEEKRLKNWVTIQGKPADALIHGCYHI